MSNSKFKTDFAKILAKAGAKAELVTRRAAVELQSMMIERSAVDTGRFKSNWQAGLGAVNIDTSATAGSDSKGRTISVLEGWKPGQTIFLSNSLPYAKRLENGWSQQAPYGIVRLSVQLFSQAVAKAASEIK